MSETRIEGIGFKISADESSALRSLDAVISKLKSLKRLVADGSVSSGLSSIGKALTDIKGVGATDLNRITRLVSALASLREIKISDNIATAISGIAEATRGLTNEDISRVKQFSEAMGGFASLQGVSASAIRAARGSTGITSNPTETALEGVSEAAQTATTDLDAYAKARAEAFAEFQAELNPDAKWSGTTLPALTDQTANLQVTDGLIDRYKELQMLTRTDPFTTEKSSLPGLIDLYKELDSVKAKAVNYGQDHTIPLPDSIQAQRAAQFFHEQMSIMPSLRQQWEQLRDQEGMTAEELQHWAQEASAAINQSIADVQREQAAEEQLLRIRRQLSETNMGSAPDATSGGGMSSFFGELKSGFSEIAPKIGVAVGGMRTMYGVVKNHILPAMSKFYSTAGGIAKTLGAGTFNYLTRGIRNAASSMSTLMSQFGRVALFRLLRTLVKDVGAAFTEGIKNMYQWSLGVDRTFANAMDRISTASQYIKNSVAAMVSPFLESLAPVIDYIADKIVSLFNLINQLFALLSGRGYWTKAVKSTKQFAAAAGGAAGATGGLKKQLDLVLASFDELHLLAKSASSGGGGGGGGGAGGVDYGAMFENVAFDQTLKDLIDRGDWFGLGKYFAEKLNAITLAADNWLVNTFEPWAVKWATNLGMIINGFVANYDWALLGKTVADGMMAIVRAANAFLTTTNFLAVGRGVGTAIKSWFDNVNWTEVADYFANKLNAAIFFAKGLFLETLGSTDPVAFGKGVASTIQYWFSRVDWYGVAMVLERGMNWVIDSFAAFVQSDQMWSEVGAAFDVLFDVADKVDWKKLGKSLGDAFVHLLGLVDWEGVGEALGELVSGVDWGSVIDAAWGAFKTALDSFLTTSDIGNIIGEKILAKIFPPLQKKFDEDQYWSGIFDKIKEKLGLAKDTTDTGLDDIKGSVSDKTDAIRNITRDNLSGGFGDASAEVGSYVSKYNSSANGSLNTSGSLDIGKQTKEPIKNNLLSGIEGATADTENKIREFNQRATGGIHSSGTLDIGKETKEPLGNNFMSGFKQAADLSLNQTKIMSDTFKKNISSAGVGKVGDDAAKNIKDVFANTFTYNQTISSKIASWIRSVKNALSGILNGVNLGTPTASMPTYTPTKSGNGAVSFTRAYVTPMASGGVLDAGELYLAREAGAELVGRIGSQNAVVNNEQIVQAVSRGVAQAVAQAMGSGGNNHTTVELVGDARALFKAVVKENNSTVARTGNSPLLI